MDGLFMVIGALIILAIGVLFGNAISYPTMNDVVTLDNQRCILVYEQDLIHKFCEAK